MRHFYMFNFPLQTDKFRHLKLKAELPHNQTSLEYAAAQSPCGLHSFRANFSVMNLGDLIISPRMPRVFRYCAGSCDSPYSLDAREQNYVTHDVLIRQIANLTHVRLSDEQKEKFKTPCCVPIEYMGDRVTIATTKGVKTVIWDTATPSRCGCR